MMDLEAMRQVDVRTVDPEELVDIKDVVIRDDLPQEEKIRDYVKQIKNPYCYKCNGMIVKISYAENSNRTIDDCMKTLMQLAPK